MLTEDQTYILNNYYNKTRKELSEDLNKTPYQIRKEVSNLMSSGNLSPKNPSTDSRVSPEKQSYLINNYSTLTRTQLAENLGETPRWVKRQISKLISEGKIQGKRGEIRDCLTDDFWTEDLVNYVMSLRIDNLMSTKDIKKFLKEEKKIDLPCHTIEHFLIKKQKCRMPSKKEWLYSKLDKELAKKLLEEGYSMTDVSEYLSDKYGVYVSDDIILGYFNDLGLGGKKAYSIKKVREKSLEFDGEWLLEKVNSHAGLRGISEDMGVSSTVVRKRLKEEGIKLIKHRVVWGFDLEEIRNDFLRLDLEDVYITPEEEHQMILGWLLGDGSLNKDGKLSIFHNINQLGYLYIKYRVLKRYVSSVFTVPSKCVLVGGLYVNSNAQIGFSCTGLDKYIKYLNIVDSEDGEGSVANKRYEDLIKELSPLGISCYFMDDGSFYSGKKVITMKDELAKYFKNKYFFGDFVNSHSLECNGVDSRYILPIFSQKVRDKSAGSFWTDKFPELVSVGEINNVIDLSLVPPTSIEDNDEILNEIVNFYQNKHGFPYYTVSPSFLEKELKSLNSLDTKYLWKDETILRSTHIGDSIFKHYVKHMVEAKSKGMSPVETFNNFAIFRDVLKKCAETKKSILPKTVYDYLMFSSRAVSGFPCGIAKAVVDKYSKKGDLVVDPCSGWGGRMIGAVSSERKYFGFEPWEKTHGCLEDIKNFISSKDSIIINRKFNLHDSPKECDLIFTSPPYGDFEEYESRQGIEEWKELMHDIFVCAESSLKKDCYLILNIPKYLKLMLPSTSLLPEDTVYWFSSSRKRSKKTAETLYVWKK